MPPKKVEKGKGAEPPPQPDDSSEREMVEKELVIGYLKSKLGRYQEHGDKLQIENLKLNDDLETQKLNLRDINEFLTNELKARSLTTSALEAKVFELNQLLEEVRKGHESALNKLRAEKDKELDGLRATISAFEQKSKTVQEFLDMKDAMESELASLKEELATKVKDYEFRLTDMDRQHIQDREKWKREMAQKIKETKIQMMKLTDNQLEMTTKRTIMENEQMSIELSYQSRQTEKLMGKNTVLMEENADLRRQLGLSKQTEEELAKRNNAYQKTIKSLLAKMKEQGSAQQESGSIIKDLEDRATDLESQLHLSRLQLGEQAQALDALEGRLVERQAALEAATAPYDEIARFLVQCMDDVRDKIVTVVRTEPSPGLASAAGGSMNLAALLPDVRGGAQGAMGMAGPLLEGPPPAPADISVLPGRLEELAPEQRERVLSYLLEKLHVFTHQRAAAAPLPPTSSALGVPSTASGGAVIGGLGAAAGAGPGGGVTLPPIPAYPRRNPTTTSPISHTLVATSGPAPLPLGMPSAAATAAQLQGVPSSSLLGDTQGVGAATSLNASWPQPGAASGSGPQGATGSLLLASRHAAGSRGSQKGAPVESVPAQGYGSALQQDMVAQSGLPPVDDLLAKVMSDVRPWGKRAGDSPMVTGSGQGGSGALGSPSRGGGGGVFVKRAPGAGSSPASRAK